MTLTGSGIVPDRPLRADAERNRRRILAAATELFAQRGLDVGLDEIAKHAGVGTGTVYRRFPDKTLLIEALFEDRICAMVQRARDAASCPDPWAGLVSFIEGMAEQQLADQGLKELLLGGTCPARTFPERRAELLPLVNTLVLRAKDSGQVRSDLDTSDVLMIQVMLHAAGAFSAGADPGGWRRQLGLILDGLRTRRSEPTPLPVPPMPLSQVELLCGLSPGASDPG